MKQIRVKHKYMQVHKRYCHPLFFFSFFALNNNKGVLTLLSYEVHTPHQKIRGESSDTFLSFSLAWIQPLNFTISLVEEANLSIGFSSGKGSHLLLVRLLGLLLFFDNAERGVEVGKLQQGK